MIKSIINIGSQAVVKLLFSVASLKIVAYYAGPSGMALLGQLQSFLQIAAAGASSMTSTGVVKLISEGRHKEDKVLASSFFILVAYSVVLFLIFLIFAEVFSIFFLDGQLVLALLLIPLAAFFLGVSSLFISYYNGRQNYRKYFAYSIILSFLSSLFTGLLAYYFQREGAVYSVILAPIAAGVLLLFVFRVRVQNWKILSFSEFWPLAGTLAQFSLMAIGSAIVVYGGQIYLRYFISDNVSVEAAGLWYSATRLSDIYIGIASVLFSTILLPRYSALNGQILVREIIRMLIVAILFALAMIFSVKMASNFLVRIIYGENFGNVSGVLDLYVIGDAFKVVTWVFLYVFIAKQKVLYYLVYEVASAVGYVVFSMLAYKYLSFSNMALGYVAQAAISLVALVCWFTIFSRKSKKLRRGCS